MFFKILFFVLMGDNFIWWHANWPSRLHIHRFGELRCEHLGMGWGLCSAVGFVLFTTGRESMRRCNILLFQKLKKYSINNKDMSKGHLEPA